MTTLNETSGGRQENVVETTISAMPRCGPYLSAQVVDQLINRLGTNNDAWPGFGALAIVLDHHDMPFGTSFAKATGRLLESAPVLLAACKLALNILQRDGILPLLGEAFNQSEVESIQTAVAKAEGGAA